MSVVSASAALEARQRDPRAAIGLGRAALDAARASGDLAEASVAERAIGLSLRELHDFPGALRHLRRSVRLAGAAGSDRLTALSRLSLAFALSSTGRHAQALRAVEQALPRLTGGDADIAVMQRGTVLHFLCRYDEALRDYDAAIDAATRTGDHLGEARARNNRGLLRAYTGGLRAADEDFDRAAALYRELGQELAVADVRWNAGISAQRAGDVPGALTAFADAEQEYRRLAVPRPMLLVNRLELLVSVPLLEEARAEADRAIAGFADHPEFALGRAEAEFYRARVALLEGDADTAAEVADRVGHEFRRQGRDVWEASARHVGLRAGYLGGRRDRALLTAMARIADRLDALGWRVAGLEARVDAALIARDLGDTRRAAAELARAAPARRSGPAQARARGWYAEALRRELADDRRGAAVALRRGLALLDEHRLSLGAGELRALSGAHGQDLARAGLRLALTGGAGARQVLAWAESWRAGALRMTPARPPEDTGLADALTELRAVTADLERALLEGRPAGALRQRQARGEQRVRELTRRGGGGGRLLRPPTVPELADALGDAALVEYIGSEGDLLAVVVAGGRASLHRLGALDDAAREVRLLRFGLHRLVTLPARVDRSGGRAGVDHAAARLRKRLLDPLERRVDGRDLVLAPTGALGGLPWAALPGLLGRSTVVTPSAAVWLRAATAGAPAPGRAVLAAGPRLPAARGEVDAVAELTGDALVLAGEGATVDAVAAAIDGAPLAHVAAHGTFRADNPLFSALELADGPLTGYDLQRLAAPPARVVLSACDSGLSAVRPGDELLGFTAALLGAGTGALVAPVVPVPAEETAPLVVELHRGLRDGLPPATALARAQAAHAERGDLEFAAGAGFLCFGA
ncbi:MULTISPECIES: CHAT domain-containing tetratricopeptide repeat protein [Actinosynnema]|uniref:CHAT domain-containing protein n=1 Tax=Actinosynnema TaxID=40566 RepID=UPI0020A3C264|nr:CHAT domain-containing tetratricopeptide repeat protein [Actinosynnema pretiosum]